MIIGGGVPAPPSPAGRPRGATGRARRSPRGGGAWGAQTPPSTPRPRRARPGPPPPAAAAVLAPAGPAPPAAGPARAYGFTDVDGTQPPPFRMPEGWSEQLAEKHRQAVEAAPA